MNMYSQIRVGSVFILSLLLLGSTFAGSWMVNVADGTANSPPNAPSNPTPTNGSINVSITTNLTWTGGDPDGDPVTYDVFFGTNSTPGKVNANQSTTLYTPGVLNYNTTYFWKIVAWDNHSTFTAGPLWHFTSRLWVNSPPAIPHTPGPVNGTTGISVTPVLSWLGGDPDNETVTYDVYFGANNPPAMVSQNQSVTIYHPDSLSYNTTYYWMIVAWDSHNASTSGPLWHFTTLVNEKITVVIESPIANSLYIMDQRKGNVTNRTIVYGPITITANVSSDEDIAWVTFYADGKEIKNLTKNASGIYSYTWRPLISFHGLSLNRNITVVAVDTENNHASAQINITKWRFHPLPFIVGAALVASVLVPHTNVEALVIHLKESGLGITFYAIRLHYKTVGPFQTLKGTVHFRYCRVNILIGPITMLKVGPFHSIARITFTCLGSVHYGKGNTGGVSSGLFKKIFQPVNKQ